MPRQPESVRTRSPLAHLMLSSLLALLAMHFGAQLAPAQTVVSTQYGAETQSGFGVVAPAGDIDHDGVPDLLVGAPLHDAPGVGEDAGLVRVLAGSDGHVLLTLHGAAGNELFGTAVTGLGDVDGDGTADLLVGAPGRLDAIGHARVHSGATGALLFTLSAAQPGDRFGAAVAATADLDGDGIGDLLVGAPGTDVAGSPPLQDAGAAYVYSGDTGLPLHVFHGVLAGDHLGSSVSGMPVGTLLGDDEPTVVIGCTQGDDNVATGPGLLRVHSGTDWSLRFAASGSASGDRFGSAVSAPGDLDADGVGDVLVGSLGGYARLLNGATGAVLASFTGPTATHFGAGVGGVGDVNGDGVADLAIGEPGADAAGIDAGAVHVYSGTDHAELHVVHGPQPHALAGASVAGAGDVNADLLADVAVGAPGPGADGQAPGGVFTLSLTRWQDQGGGLPGIHDIPRLSGQGGLVANTEVDLLLTGARSLASVTMVLGTAVSINAFNGTLTPLPEIVTTGLLTDSVGGLHYTFTWPTGMPSGQTVYYQFRVSDPVAVGGDALSNTLAAVVP